MQGVIPLTSLTAHVAAPGFWLAVHATPAFVTGIEFLTTAPAPFHPAAPGTVLADAVEQIRHWLRDARTPLTFPVQTYGTPFRQRVWAAIAAIPCGETRRYGDIARALNSAPRAVGQACGDNPVPIRVPCHRVVSQAGLGGFNHDTGDALLNIKRWLLAHEGGVAL